MSRRTDEQRHADAEWELVEESWRKDARSRIRRLELRTREAVQAAVTRTRASGVATHARRSTDESRNELARQAGAAHARADQALAALTAEVNRTLRLAHRALDDIVQDLEEGSTADALKAAKALRREVL